MTLFRALADPARQNPRRMRSEDTCRSGRQNGDPGIHEFEKRKTAGAVGDAAEPMLAAARAGGDIMLLTGAEVPLRAARR